MIERMRKVKERKKNNYERKTELMKERIKEKKE